MLLFALLFPAALGVSFVLLMTVMAGVLVHVDFAGMLRLWPIAAGIAGPTYLIAFWWLTGVWREQKDASKTDSADV